MDVAIVSTSINEAPSAYAEWAKLGRLFIAGDENTPIGLQDFIQSLGSEHMFFGPDAQRRWKSSKVIGWHSIQRRNIAILEAIASGAERIITVDDDNIPLTDIEHILDAFNPTSPLLFVGSKSGWYNPCEHLHPQVYHRGFPYSQRPTREVDATLTRSDYMVNPTGVVAAMWMGEPDVGAIDRMAKPTTVYGCHEVLRKRDIVLMEGTWAPFNSQATAWNAKYAALMMCWPGVGRFDDILASFIARRILDELGVMVRYTRPLVRQDRNDHNVLKDIKAEMWGLENQDVICQFVRDIDLRNFKRDPLIMLNYIYELLTRDRLVPAQTSESFDAWIEDVKDAEEMRDV